MFETGALEDGDTCRIKDDDPWIPIGDHIRSLPKFHWNRIRMGKQAGPSKRPLRKRSRAIRVAWIAASAAMFLAGCAWILAWTRSNEILQLRDRLSRTDAANTVLQEKYHQVLFAAREVAASDLIRGRVIVRAASGKRVALPGIKVRLYTRAEIESRLAEGEKSAGAAAGTGPDQVAAHYLKNLPNPIATSTSDSGGRFEMKIPSPGEYVIQTSIRSMKTGQMKLWFVSFDSRDPLNTPVDLTESNSARQFNPLLMVVEGR